MANKYGTKEIKRDIKRQGVEAVSYILGERHPGTSAKQWLPLINKIKAGGKPTPEDWAIEPAPVAPEPVKVEPKSAAGEKKAVAPKEKSPYGDAEIMRDLKLGYSRNQIAYKLQVRDKAADLTVLIEQVDRINAQRKAEAKK